jgi:peptidoglycan-associated lipoprotein
MKRISAATVVAVLAGLYGCATTESQPENTPAAVPPVSQTKQAPAMDTTTRSGVQDARTSAPAGQQRPDLKRSVYFEFDKYEVKSEYRTLVETHARWLKSNPQARLTIEGNADERGSREYNLALGQKRAEAVTKMMVLLGAKPEQIEAVSWGEEKPRATSHDEKAWSENRRSDFAAR